MENSQHDNSHLNSNLGVPFSTGVYKLSLHTKHRYIVVDSLRLHIAVVLGVLVVAGVVVRVALRGALLHISCRQLF